MSNQRIIDRERKELVRYIFTGVSILIFIVCLSFVTAFIISAINNPIPTYNIACYSNEKVIVFKENVFINARWWVDENGNYLDFKRTVCVYDRLEQAIKEE